MGIGLETPPMAKRAAGKKAPPKGRPLAAEGPKRQILGIRGSEAYKAWIVEFAEHERSDLVDLVDDALAAYARAREFKAPPKR